MEGLKPPTSLPAGALSLSYIHMHASGGPERDRTADLPVANGALSQLSYKPVVWSATGTCRPRVAGHPVASGA